MCAVDTDTGGAAMGTISVCVCGRLCGVGGGSPGVMEGKPRTVAMGKHRMIDRLRK